jgi:predicted PurR-regulated permease PerM
MKILDEVASWAENNVPLIGSFLAWVIRWINDKLEPFLDIITQLWNAFQYIASLAYSTVTQVISWIYNTLKNAWDWIVKTGTWIYNWILDKGIQLWNWISDTGKWISNWISEKGTQLWNWISEKGTQLWNWLSNSWPVLYSWIKDGINYTKDWIDNTGKWLKDKWEAWDKEWPTWKSRIEWFWNNWPRTIADLVNILVTVYKEAFMMVADAFFSLFIQLLFDLEIEVDVGESVKKPEYASISTLLAPVEGE